MASILDGSYHVAGNLSANSMTVPSNAVGNSAIRSGDPIDASKLENQQVITKHLSAHATAASVTRQVIHAVYGATATLIAFHVGCTVAPTGADTVTINLKRNGTNILSGDITLDNTNTNFIVEAGTLTTTDVVAGDVIEVDVSAVSGTTAKGLFARLIVREQPSP